MSSKKDRGNNKDYWIVGGILAVLGVYLMMTAKSLDDIKNGFVLLGFGLIFMAATSKEFRRRLFDFFFSVFKGLWKILGR